MRDRKNEKERVLKVLEDDTGCKRQQRKRGEEGGRKGGVKRRRDPSQTGS